MSLTDSWLKAHHKKPHEKTLEKADGEGLSARVSPAGKIVFQMRYRWAGKPARLDLGAYPRMSLREARTEHQRLKGELEQGRDPKTVRMVETARLAEAHTNESLYRLWHKQYCKENKQQHQEILRSFEIHVFPELGRMPADDTSAHQWMTLIEGIAAGKPSIAERILSNTQQLHRWAYRRELITKKPLADVSAVGDLMIAREDAGRALSDEEVCLFWHSISRTKMAHANKLFLKLCLFFGCRNGELRDLDPTEDLDLEAMTWTVPPEKNKVRKKIKRAIVRPIIPEVLPYIKEAMSLSNSKRRLFTAETGDKRMAQGTVLGFPYAVRRSAKRYFGVEMAHWSMHDLRKTARTNFSTLADVHVAEVMLGHSLKGMQGIYDRHDYLEEQASAYKKWWHRLEELTREPPSPRL